jgi:hypothetical protein
MICMYSSSLLFSDFLKSDVCWFYSLSETTFFMIDNGYSDHENLTHLKGAFVQSSNIQYHVDWRHKMCENKLRHQCERWGELDSDIIVIRPSDGFINDKDLLQTERVYCSTFWESSASKSSWQYSKENWDYPSRSELIDVTYGGYHKDPGLILLAVAEWHNG